MLKSLRLIAALALCLSAPLAVSAAESAAKGLDGVFYDEAYVIGSPKAKVTVTEYASVTCPHCARFDAVIYPQIKAKYIDTGKVRYEFREFLTPPEGIAASGFVVARCAGKDNYFKIVEAIFRAQPEMFSGKPGSEPAVVLGQIARTNGVTDERFHACLNDPKAVDALNARMDHAINQEKIDSTPTVLVNGKKVDPGLSEWTMEKIAPSIEAALRAAR